MPKVHLSHYSFSLFQIEDRFGMYEYFFNKFDMGVIASMCAEIAKGIYQNSLFNLANEKYKGLFDGLRRHACTLLIVNMQKQELFSLFILVQLY